MLKNRFRILACRRTGQNERLPADTDETAKIFDMDSLAVGTSHVALQAGDPDSGFEIFF
jgi:hypothetical protein